MVKTSTASAHTPGPWTIDQYGSIVANFDGESVQITSISPTQWCGKMTKEDRAKSEKFKSQMEKNAILMAAAPELLEACKMAFDQKNASAHGQRTPHNDIDLLNTLRAAIAKAEGTLSA